ncbi:MAG: sulfatase [Lunatimonas sp.]|uniref:sulfatase family protein n=1 Tax=Lunatimonas sp. TaxID=2060141 RepID=UPI00263BB3E7|nr:sulfatase [Lunatimonas sp.]MCC5939223.1 sulfatase [Lunatimonas sp.]
MRFQLKICQAKKALTGYLLLVLIAIQACEAPKEEIPVSKPNIIFILTDDQRWDALGYAGNEIIHTPHMDQLAREGLYFENAFVTTAICAASRASLFTGLYERTHDFTFGKPALRDEYMNLSYPKLLKDAGYRTGFVGKFGVKVNEGIEDSMFHDSKKTFWPYLREIDGKQVHLADINGDLAIDFIQANKDEPFCLSLSFWSPHADDGAVEQYFWPDYVDHLYRDVDIPVHRTADPAFFDTLPEFLQTSMNRERWYWRFDTPQKYQEMVKGHYRMISAVDSVLARIRHSLEETGLADNTVIVLMGDNGYFLGERGYAGKWLLHEPSIRVPLIVYDPRLSETQRGKTFSEMVLNVDITPTLLDLAGVTIPSEYQGESLTAFYRGKPQAWRSGIYLEHRLENNPSLLKTAGYRDDAYKFIRYDDYDYLELYHHKTDTDEVHNLALDPGFADKVSFYAQVVDSITHRLLDARVGN